MRIAAYIGLIGMALVVPFEFFLFCTFLYILVWDGYETLVLAATVDALFGVSSTAFLYTLSVGSIHIVLSLLRPYLSWYTIES